MEHERQPQIRVAVRKGLALRACCGLNAECQAAEHDAGLPSSYGNVHMPAIMLLAVGLDAPTELGKGPQAMLGADVERTLHRGNAALVDVDKGGVGPAVAMRRNDRQRLRHGGASRATARCHPVDGPPYQPILERFR